jgi:signal transduction histidine kinase
MVREALHNVVKHASATQVRLSMEEDGAGKLVLEVVDNGVGFDPEAERPGHLGLGTMAERAQRIGGTFTVQSGAGDGTSVRITVPLGAQER